MYFEIIDRILRRKGYERALIFPPDAEEDFKPIYAACKPFTMTSAERMYCLYKSVEYVVRNDIPGDFVECGVWKGGSAMIAARSFLHFGQSHRKFYLYDTYEGMAEPGEKDKSISGADARVTYRATWKETYTDWAYAPLEDVRHNLYSTGYPQENLRFVKGKVEDTIPATIPDRIALLRLDTDFYASSYHELTHLYPRLSTHGVLIIDDYGHWKGQREAVDRYFAETREKVLLSRIDYTGRVAVKLS